MLLFGAIGEGRTLNPFNKLKNLIGSPEKVGEDFYCSGCKSLISLEGAPKEVGGLFYAVRCEKLKNLNGVPEKVGRLQCDILK